MWLGGLFTATRTRKSRLWCMFKPAEDRLTFAGSETSENIRTPVSPQDVLKVRIGQMPEHIKGIIVFDPAKPRRGLWKIAPGAAPAEPGVERGEGTAPRRRRENPATHSVSYFPWAWVIFFSRHFQGAGCREIVTPGFASLRPGLPSRASSRPPGNAGSEIALPFPQAPGSILRGKFGWTASGRAQRVGSQGGRGWDTDASNYFENIPASLPPRGDVSGDLGS